MTEECQERIFKSRVLILGASEIAYVVADYLTKLGTGVIELAGASHYDLQTVAERVEPKPGEKVETQIIVSKTNFDSHDSEELISRCDVVVDALSDWQLKLVASDTCMRLSLPLVHSGGDGFRYQLYTMRPGQSACLRCVFPRIGIDDFPIAQDESAIFPPVQGTIGALQALEAAKLAGRLGASQGNELMKFDFLSGEMETITGFDPVKDCPDCDKRRR